MPLFQKAGFLVKMLVKNRAEPKITLKVVPCLTPGNPRLVELSAWDFMPPKVGTDVMKQRSEEIWKNCTVRETLLKEECEEIILGRGQTHECRAAVVFSKAGDMVIKEDLSLWQSEWILR